MPDTVRTKSELLLIFQDNTSGDITAQDARDFIVTFFEGHAELTTNPHSVTASQVGNTTAQWNASDLQGRDVASTAPSDGESLVWNNSLSQWEPQLISGGGTLTVEEDNVSVVGSATIVNFGAGFDVTSAGGGQADVVAEVIVNAQTSGYTALAGDRAKIIRYTSSGGVTLALTAAATLTNGWFTFVRNDSSGNITINPDGAETINEAATFILRPGEGIAVFCDGTDFYTIGNVVDANINHDALLNFVGNEHVDHTSVTLTAGDGLSGGGDISANRTFDVDINSETLVTVAADDEILIADDSDNFNIKKVTAQDIADLAAGASIDVDEGGVNVVSGLTVLDFGNGFDVTDGTGGEADIVVDPAEIDHDALLNFVGNEHVDHTAVTLTAGAGLSGGGDISANRTFDAKTVVNTQTSGYTALAGDRAKVIRYTGSGGVTLALTAAVTLTDGWFTYVHNDSSGNITINPDGAETINEAATFILRPSEGVVVHCDGTDFYTTGGVIDANINHNSLVNYDANRHIDHTAVTLTAGDGLSGGGDISANRTFDIDINSEASVSAAADDEILIADDSDSFNIKKVTVQSIIDLAGGGGGGTVQGSSPNTYAIEATNEGTTPGNNRGENSVDLQTDRAAAAQVASGTHSAIVAGANNTASGNYSIASGLGAVANLYGQQASAAGIFAAVGDAQTCEYILRVQTTDGSQTEMFLDGSSSRMALANNTTWMFNVFIAARRTDADNEGAAYIFQGAIDRNANAASTGLIGGVSKIVLTEDTVAWDVDVTADTTNGSLRLRVTGEAAKTINWVAWAKTVQVTG